MPTQSKTLALAGLALLATAVDAAPEVRAKPGARASLTIDGPWLAYPTAEDPNVRALTEIEDDRGKRVLVTTTLAHGSLRLYLDPAGLGTVAIADTALHLTPATAPLANGESGAELGRGMLIDDAVARADGTSRVAIHWAWGDETIDLSGFVTTAMLGKRFEPGVFDPSAPRRRRPTLDLDLPANFQLLDKPAGHVFATRHGKTAAAASTVTTLGAYTLVRLVADVDGFVVTGWIASAQTRASRSRSGDELVGGLLGGPGERPVTIYDAVDGRAVGRLWAPSQEHGVAHVSDWTRYDLATQFGTAPVWVRDIDLLSNRAHDADRDSP